MSRGIWQPSVVDVKLLKSRQETPKSSQNDSKRAPKRFQNQLWTNVKIFEGKSRFLRVGGSVWELKIDPKRPRKKIKDDIEERITNINEKEAARSEQTRPNKVSRGIWKPFVVDVEPRKSPQETQKSSQKEPKRAPNAFKTIFGSKTVFLRNVKIP